MGTSSQLNKKREILEASPSDKQKKIRNMQMSNLKGKNFENDSLQNVESARSIMKESFVNGSPV
jgi:hypothetical protein